MRLIFVHGWSVTHTNTYGDFPQSVQTEAKQRGLDLSIEHIHLGKYISFQDEVTIDDIARAMDYALRELAGPDRDIEEFSCITHSTGGPVVRYWLERYYGAPGLSSAPLRHLIMLAPANHGSSLAIIGKQRIGRLKAWFNDVEPGQRVLDWLVLGSDGQRQLNEAFLRYKPGRDNFYPFVITGQGIDTSFYDFLNSYLVENGSDGVVRVAGANLNYRYLNLHQTDQVLDESQGSTRLLAPRQAVRRAPGVPLAVLHNVSHSGRTMGILAAAKNKQAHHNTVHRVVDCLAVNNPTDYRQVDKAFTQLSRDEQLKTPKGKDHPVDRYSMLVLRVSDQFGNPVASGDFDILLLGGPDYQPDQLPKGFFVDRQLNPKSHALVYYLNADKMQALDNGFGLRVVVRPDSGFAYFTQAEFRSEGLAVDKVFAANETTYVNITVQRRVDKNIFRFSPARGKTENFKRTRPSGDNVP